MLKDYKGDPMASQAEAFVATPRNIESRTQRFELPSGMEVALLPKGTRGGAVQARLILRYGDEKSLFGLGDVPAFTAAMLERGTARRSRQEIEDRFAKLRAQVSFGGDASGMVASVVTVRENLPAVIEFVGEVMREASFPADALEELRRQALAGIEARRKEPEVLVDDAINRHGNPYPRGDVRHARTFDERIADVKSVTVEQLKAFHSRFYGTSHAQFAASGDIDATAVRQALERAFGEWRSGMPFTRIPNPLIEVPPTRFMIRTPDKQNASMQVRQALPVTENDADYPLLMLANRLLGQGGNSRLWLRIRETEGLSYDVRTGIDWNAHEPNSTWESGAIFAPQNRAKVEAAFRDELERALAKGFSEQELEEAKRGLLSGRQLARSQDGNLASALARNLYLGRDFMVSQKVDDAIASATLEQVNAVLRKYLRPERFVYGFGGDFPD
jgi:zinc protease